MFHGFSVPTRLMAQSNRRHVGTPRFAHPATRFPLVRPKRYRRTLIRRLKHPTERVEQDQQKAERRHQIEDQRTALQNICRQLEHATEEREQQYIALCRSVGKEPKPFSPPLSPEAEPPLSVAEDLERAFRVLLMVRGFDPRADNIKRAIEEFVRAVLAQQQ